MNTYMCVTGQAWRWNGEETGKSPQSSRATKPYHPLCGRVLSPSQSRSLLSFDQNILLHINLCSLWSETFFLNSMTMDSVQNFDADAYILIDSYHLVWFLLLR